MSYWGQPWGRLEVEGRLCRLQVLDPEAAFDLEAAIIARVDSTQLRTLTQPDAVINVITQITDLVTPVARAAATLQRLGQLAAELLADTPDGKWAATMFDRLVFDRLTVGRAEVGCWSEWGDLGLGPLAKWQMLGSQVGQTYGPLWSRSPYRAGGRKVKDYGVPNPNSSRTVQWAAGIALMGYASSSEEILRNWTPERLIDHVEIAAERNERERRAADEAKAGTG